MVKAYELVHFTLNILHFPQSRVRLFLRAPKFFFQSTTAYVKMENILRWIKDKFEIFFIEKCSRIAPL
jgi:hypothetical protein